jgi:RHS repeat-associated protein
LKTPSSPDTGFTYYTYTPTGHLSSKTLNNGKTTRYVYDTQGRLKEILYDNSEENVGFTYDQGQYCKGRLTGKNGQDYSYSYTYTIAGQIESVTQTTDSKVFTTVYSYDDSGILTGITYPDSRTVNYGLDANGKYLSVSTTKSEISTPLVSQVTYKPFGPLSGLTFGNDITLNQSFNQDYLLTDYSAGEVLNLTYECNPDGMIIDIVNHFDSSRDQSFTYDDMNRLTSATGIYGDITFTYDSVGNRLSKTENSITDYYAYIPGSNTINFVNGDVFKGFAHDDNGNISILNSEVMTGTLGGSEYLYNDNGQRIRKTTDGQSVYYHYDFSGNLIAESDASGSVVTSYIYMGGSRIAKVAMDGTVCYYHNNHLATPEVMTDETGAIVWKADYKPFGGALIDSTSTITNDFRFPGQYFDSETGLHYNWNRYYDPSTGRYLTADPIGLTGGINLYAYVLNDPVNLIDPEGLEFLLLGRGSAVFRPIGRLAPNQRYVPRPIPRPTPKPDLIPTGRYIPPVELQDPWWAETLKLLADALGWGGAGATGYGGAAIIPDGDGCPGGTDSSDNSTDKQDMRHYPYDPLFNPVGYL